VPIASLGASTHVLEEASGRALIGRLRVAGASVASLWSAGGAMNLSNDGAPWSFSLWWSRFSLISFLSGGPLDVKVAYQ